MEDDVLLPVHVTPAAPSTGGGGTGGDAGGGRPPVLLLHGFPGSWRSFDAVVPALAAAGHRCLVPELRGYTPSGRPQDVGRYRLERLVADAVAVLDALGGPDDEVGGPDDEVGGPDDEVGGADDEVGGADDEVGGADDEVGGADDEVGGAGSTAGEAGRAGVVGHDWGAVVAWALAAAHPDRVAGLVTVSVPHPRAYAAGLREDRGQQLRSAYVRLLRRRGTAERVLLAGGGRVLRQAFAGSAVPPDLVDAHLGPLSGAEELAGALAWYRALRVRDLMSVGPVAVPTTYLWSDRDPFVARGTADRCGEHVTGPFRARTLHGTSHWVPEEEPGEVVRAVLEPPTR